MVAVELLVLLWLFAVVVVRGAEGGEVISTHSAFRDRLEWSSRPGLSA